MPESHKRPRADMGSDLWASGTDSAWRCELELIRMVVGVGGSHLAATFVEIV